VQPSADPPSGKGWLHEVKHDGHRVVAISDGAGGLKLLSRNGYDVTAKFGPALTGLVESGRALVLDREIGVPDETGVTHLDHLNDAVQRRQPERLAYFVFDLLFLDAFDLTPCRIEDRKNALEEVLRSAGAPRVVYVDHLIGEGEALFKAACGAGAEGIVSKRLGSRYRAGPSCGWLKTKKAEGGRS
jgi:bifunctional non-homologous end joining protein LigD